MSGHNKWSKIKRQKEKTDGQKSKIYGKFAGLNSSDVHQIFNQLTLHLCRLLDHLNCMLKFIGIEFLFLNKLRPRENGCEWRTKI